MSTNPRSIAITSEPLTGETGTPLGTTLGREALVAAYHERTKHQPHRYAASLGYMDWATQPDPFRRYAGAELLKLPLMRPGTTPAYRQLYAPEEIVPQALSLQTISQFFRYSLALTAWKQSGSTRWPLRANPSSGNLHPTEGYAILPAISGLVATPGVYHYAPKEHGLERRGVMEGAAYREFVSSWPNESYLVGLSSIHWREAWKYGERAFRYCQHDTGHALAALRISAAALGWRLTCLEGVPSATIAGLLGLDRDDDYSRAEREEPELLAFVMPNGASVPTSRFGDINPNAIVTSWYGQANRLSARHAVDWTAISEVADATRRERSEQIAEDFSDMPSDTELVGATAGVGQRSAAEVILGRRSAVAMDGETAIPSETFFRMLSRLMPTHGSRTIPWDAIPWRPRVHLGIFVHRVDDFARGLYALVRDPSKLSALKAATDRDFVWRRVPSAPMGLPLYLLKEGDFRQVATALSCGQAIAGDGAFSLSMLAEYTSNLSLHGPAIYRRLFWEAGMVGQVLYLEAQAAGIGGTGIGCYFDDLVHEVFGLGSSDWQSLYHFTVGGPVEDARLTTFLAYDSTLPSDD